MRLGLASARRAALMSSRPCPAATAACHWPESAASSGGASPRAAAIARSTSFSAHASGNSAAISPPVHLVELGVGDRRVQWAALDDLGELLVTDSEAIGELHGFGHALDENGHVGVHDQLHLAALAGLTQPHGLAAEDVEHRLCRVGRRGGPRCQDQQLTLFGRALAARHRGVHEHDARPLCGQPVPAAQGRLNADRAHLRPHRSVGERAGHTAVEDHRIHDIGGGQHRDYHARVPHRIPR